VVSLFFSGGRVYNNYMRNSQTPGNGGDRMSDIQERPGTSRVARTAIFAALAAVLGLAGIYIPPLSVLTSFLWLLPLIVITLKEGLRGGLLSLTAAAVLIGLVASPLPALFLTLEYGGLALVYGMAFRRGYPLHRVLVAGVAVAVAGTILVFLLSMAVTGVGFGEITRQLDDMSRWTMDVYEQTGLTDLMLERGISREELADMVDSMAVLAISILPGIVLIGSVFTALMALLISRAILERLKIPVPEKLPPFSRWRMDWRLIWGFMLGLVLILAGSSLDLELVSIAGRNLVTVFAFIFGVAGFSIMVYFWQKAPRGIVRILMLVIGVAYFQITLYLLVFTGMFDLFFDYRRRYENIGGKSDGSNSQQ